MPGDRPHRSPTTPLLTCLPAQDQFLLRPQLLTPISVLPSCCLALTVMRKNGRSVKPFAHSSDSERSLLRMSPYCLCLHMCMWQCCESGTNDASVF
jgi:hypothetical protein